MHLFVYGVLQEGLGDWPFLAGLGPGRPATATGALFAIADPHGWYPALLPGEGTVVGTLHDARAVDLAAVDAFEGTDYIRRPIPVRCAGETLVAEAYLWAGALPPGAPQIVHGDFARWLAETGHKAFGKHL